MKVLMEQWRRYTQSLDEGAIDDALKKLPRGIPEETWKEYLILMRELDPSGKSKYVRWAAAELRPIMLPHGQEERHDETADNVNMEKITRFMDTIKKYDELLPHIKASKDHKEFVDIGKVKGISQLRNLVWDMEDLAKLKAVEKETGKKKSELAAMESEVIDSEEGLFILRRPYTTHASCHYGRGTKWCVSGDKSNQFMNYADEGIAIFFLDILVDLPEGRKTFKKTAFAIAYEEYDLNDTDIDTVYDQVDNSFSYDQFIHFMEGIIPAERIDKMLSKMIKHTNERPPIKDGVGSDAGEPFKGDAEWDPEQRARVSSWEDVMGIEERDYQKESERIKQHSKRKKELIGVGGRSKGAPPGA